MIDLIEDRITAEYLVDEGFSLYELYDIHDKLKNLEKIKHQMVENSMMMDLNNSLALHHNHLDIIHSNLTNIMKVIVSGEAKICRDLGDFGKLYLQ